VATPRGRLHGWLVPFLLATLAVLPFGLAIGAGFVFDDEGEVLWNADASAASFLVRLVHKVRPLLKASYALGALLHGPSALGFRLVNVALHAATGVLVFLVVERWLSSRRVESARAAAFAGAALWALHPLAAETVTYVSGRSMGLSTFLVLAAMWIATRDDAPSPPRAAVAGALAFLAPMAKETALALPLLLLWWEATLGPRDVPWRLRLRKHAPVLAGTIAAALVIAVLPRHRELTAFSLAARSPLAALRGNVHASSAMLGLWAFPWRLSIDPAAPLEWGWTEGPTLIRLLGLGALGFFAFALRRRAPWPAFAIGWMLIAIAPSNSILWRLDPVGVRPLYLASVGPACLAAYLVHAASRHPVYGRLALASALALAGALGLGLAQRNALYRTPVALWEDAARKAPRNARAKANLGFAYLAEGRLDEAQQALESAVDRAPWMRQAQCGLEAIRIRKETIAWKSSAENRRP
jgi:protein O-mannosyl-transferase